MFGLKGASDGAGEGSAWSMRVRPPTDADLKSLLDRVQLPGCLLHAVLCCVCCVLCQAESQVSQACRLPSARPAVRCCAMLCRAVLQYCTLCVPASS